VKRGSFVSVASPGDFGKPTPTPALVIQSDLFGEHASVTVLLVSSARIEAPLIRIDVLPTPRNGLRLPSQVMIDKAMTLSRERIGAMFGEADDQLMLEVGRLLAVFLGIAR
jgi:mRNA interferase MazF